MASLQPRFPHAHDWLSPYDGGVPRIFPIQAALAVTVLATSVAATAMAQGPVGVPSTFWGSVASDGTAVPAGTEVRGFIDGRDCTQLGANHRPVAVDGGVSSYAIEVVHESQAPGCGAEGRMVTFTVGGTVAAQSVPWAFGPTRIDLTAGGGQALPLPSPTPTPSQSSAAMTATASVASAFTPISGTPPLDTIDPKDLFGGATSESTPGVPDSGGDDESSALVPLGLAVVAIGAVGLAGGWWLARRSGPRKG